MADNGATFMIVASNPPDCDRNNGYGGRRYHPPTLQDIIGI